MRVTSHLQHLRVDNLFAAWLPNLQVQSRQNAGNRFLAEFQECTSLFMRFAETTETGDHIFGLWDCITLSELYHVIGIRGVLTCSGLNHICGSRGSGPAIYPHCLDIIICSGCGGISSHSWNLGFGIEPHFRAKRIRD